MVNTKIFIQGWYYPKSIPKKALAKQLELDKANLRKLALKIKKVPETVERYT